MANKPGEANFFPNVPEFPSMGTFQPVYGKFDLTTYIQGASDYEIMAFMVGKYNACLEAYGTATKLSTDTITAAHQLQDWINNWFDNLDVQQELNNKVDSMVADGSFGTLLHQTFDTQINQQTTNTVTAWLVANVTPTGSAVAVDKSLSIEGAAADARIAGTYIDKFAVANTGLIVNVTITAESDSHLKATVEVTGTGYLFTQHKSYSKDDFSGSMTANFNAPVDQTFAVYLLNGDIGCVQYSQFIPPDSIILWVGFISHSDGYIYNVVFDCNTMTLDKIEQNSNAIKNLNIQNIGQNTASIFTKVVCCGDSYTSGHISTSSGTTVTNEAFAWPKYAAQITGNEYINCGSSGANVLTWQTVPRGLPKAKTSGVAQCYIIGLGLNDTAIGTDRYVELGTSADIGTDAQTYYGGYSKIIRELHEISPNAIIFCQTMPMASGLKLQYNEAIRTIVNQYASTYNAKLLNLNDYDDYYRKTSVAQNFSGGHYTAAGYQQLAQILCYAISDYVNAHPDEFKDINRVPYDSTNVAILSADNEPDEVLL